MPTNESHEVQFEFAKSEWHSRVLEYSEWADEQQAPLTPDSQI